MPVRHIRSRRRCKTVRGGNGILPWINPWLPAARRWNGNPSFHIPDIYIESRAVHGYPIPTEPADPVILRCFVKQITSRRMVDDRRHVLDTQIVRLGTGQSHVVDDVFSFFIIEIAVLQNASLPYIVFCFFRTFLFCIYCNFM